MASLDWVRAAGTYSPFHRGRRSVQQKHNFLAIITFIPAIIFLFVLVAIPLLYTINISLHEASLIRTRDWVGLANYRALFTSADFWEAFEFGILFAAGSVFVHTVVGVALALLINQQFKGGFLARVTAIFPYLVPTVIVMTIWEWLLSPSYGLVNGLAVHWGFFESSISFFGHPDLVLPSLIAANSWRFTSFAVIIVLARLQSIDQSLYEQARIDGASRIQQFWFITLPNLRSAILLVILLRSIWMFNHFDTIWLLTKGGPFGQSTNIPVFIFRESFLRGDLAYGSSAAIVLFVVLAVSSAMYFRVFQPSREVEASR